MTQRVGANGRIFDRYFSRSSSKVGAGTRARMRSRSRLRRRRRTSDAEIGVPPDRVRASSITVTAGAVLPAPCSQNFMSALYLRVVSQKGSVPTKRWVMPSAGAMWLRNSSRSIAVQQSPTTPFSLKK